MTGSLADTTVLTAKMRMNNLVVVAVAVVVVARSMTGNCMILRSVGRC